MSIVREILQKEKYASAEMTIKKICSFSYCNSDGNLVCTHVAYDRRSATISRLHAEEEDFGVQRVLFLNGSRWTLLSEHETSATRLYELEY